MGYFANRARNKRLRRGDARGSIEEDMEIARCSMETAGVEIHPDHIRMVCAGVVVRSNAELALEGWLVNDTTVLHALATACAGWELTQSQILDKMAKMEDVTYEQMQRAKVNLAAMSTVDLQEAIVEVDAL